MKIVNIYTLLLLFFCGSLQAMSNECGTLKKEPTKDGVRAYTRTTELGMRTYVKRTIQDGKEEFSGYQGDIFGAMTSITLHNNETTAKLWQELHDAQEELLKLND